MDLPLYSASTRSSLSDLGRTVYLTFTKAVTLTQVMRQNGHSSEQTRFREFLLSLRDGNVTVTDWQLLMTYCLSRLEQPAKFLDAIHLHPTVQAVGEYNASQLQRNGHPIAILEAVHSGSNATNASTEDAGGLQPFLSIARNARVMLTSNLWIEAGLWSNGYYTVHLLQDRRTTTPSSCCHGQI